MIDDRFGVNHFDFKSPECQPLDEISLTKWEECRGLGRSFGYNRAEGEAETIAPDDLIYLLVDMVSKNGNLLLDIGPEADGTIPPVQVERLQALGAWLSQNGEAIYGSRPWDRATGESVEGIHVRFTQRGDAVYATLLGRPKAASITLKSLSPKPGSRVYLLGDTKPLVWSQQGLDMRVKLCLLSRSRPSRGSLQRGRGSAFYLHKTPKQRRRLRVVRSCYVGNTAILLNVFVLPAETLIGGGNSTLRW
jgi:alpha-L-fucosidase